MTFKIICTVVSCFLFFVSRSTFAVQLDVQLHSEDDIFRNDVVRIFEHVHIKSGALTKFHHRSDFGSNVLMQYYAIINPPFILDEKSIAELSKLAEANLYVAMLNLGDIYSDVGSKFYNINLAIKWYTRAVELHQSSQALDRLGFIHGVLLGDIKMAAYFYSNGCELGNASSCFNLSVAFNKAGVGKIKTISALLKAHTLGHIKAGVDLYVMYKDVDKNKAIYYLKGSADRGYREAQYFLGVEYFESNNEKLGLAYMHMAAESEFIAAQAYLGKFFSGKIKSKEDFEIAEKWYLRAAIAGDEPSRKNLLVLYEVYRELIPGLTEKRNYLGKVTK